MNPGSARAAAVIVAAGSGLRFGSRVSKQFLTLEGLPVFLWSVLAFKKTGSFRQIVLVVPENRLKPLEKYAKKYGFDLAAGGSERYDSVRAGLKKLGPGIKYAAIHDAARPLITPGLIKQGLDAARKYGASVVAVQARDTVKLAGPALNVDKTVPRTAVWLAQTPQTFSVSLINKACDNLGSHHATDDAQAVELLGKKVKIVPGDHSNFKITDRQDMKIAKMILRLHATGRKLRVKDF